MIFGLFEPKTHKKGEKSPCPIPQKLPNIASQMTNIMRSKRPLIIIPLSILLLILMVITAFVTPKKKIEGAWVSQENPTEKLEFLQNGVGNLYSENTDAKPYHYTVTTTCDEHSDYCSLFVKIIDDQQNTSKCYEVKDADSQREDVLVLVDMDNNEEHLYTKVY